MSEEPRNADGAGGDSEQGDEILGVDRRKAIITGVAAVVLGVGAVALIGHAADYSKLAKAIRHAEKVWFPVCLGGEVVAYAGYIMAYRDVARADGGLRISYWTATRVVGVGFGAFILGSSAAGLAVDFWALHRAGAKLHEAARRVLALNTLEWAVLALFAMASAAFVLGGRGPGAPLAMTLSWLIAVPVFFAAGFWVSSPRRAERLSGLHEKEERPTSRDLHAWAHWLVQEARRGLKDAIGGVIYVRHILLHPLRYPAALAGYPLYWAGDILCLYAAIRAFGGHVDVTPLVLGYTTGYVATALPLPAGGAGGMEASLALCMHLVGVPLAPAVLGTFAYRMFTFWLPIAPALALATQLKKLNEELPHTEREPTPRLRSSRRLNV